MEMEEGVMNESLIGNVGLIAFIGGFVFFASKYVRHYKQLQKAYAESGLKWPTLTREQMLAEGSIKGLYKSFAYTFKMWGIILFSRPDDDNGDTSVILLISVS